MAEITNHTTTYVWQDMAYARALGFQTTWFDRKRIEWTTDGSLGVLRKKV